MTTERTPASCDSCGKLYRVPDPTKIYSCKACDGKVCADVLAADITCPECQASIADGDEFCTQCGVALAPENEGEAAKDVVVRTSRARAKSKHSGKDREHDRAATRELTKAFKFLKILRLWFLLNVVINGIVLAFIPFTFALDGFDPNLGMLALTIQLGTTSLMVIGLFQVFFRPFLWSVVLASMVTLSRAYAIVNSDYNMVVAVLSVVWALMFWALVIPTARVRKLIDANPDLYIAKRITGASGRKRSSSVTSKEAMQLAEKKAWRNALVTVGIVAVATISASFAMYQDNKIPNFEDSWAQFHSDWSSGNVDQVSQWFRESSRGSERARLEAISTNREWGSNWPSLQDHEKEFGFVEAEGQAPKSVVLQANLSDGIASLNWRAANGSWKITNLELPDPDFETIAAAWVTAWNASDFDRLSHFFLNNEKMKRSLRSMADRRDWVSLPVVRKQTIDDSRDGYRSVYLQTDQGEILVGWTLDLDQWTASKIKPPKR